LDIAAWLHGLGLQQYEQAFRDNAIDAAILPELTSEDLKDIGVNPVGHRHRLLAAISALRGGGALGSVAGMSIVERRQLTVMFCDLVGSTALSVQRDPEDLQELIAAYHRAVAEVVKRFEGFLARYMGDGILIYFGYPRAQEDDAERAARCALLVVEAVSGLKLAEELRARIGIATGMVVVGGGASEHDVVGETPNLAARLQSLAPPNTVLIDENTRRLIGGLFEYRDLGAVEARGFMGTVSAWQVLRPSAVASRFEALRASASTPLVGRSEELEFLLRRWERARKGEGQVVLLSGEPGIGKSRITAALAERLLEGPHYHLRYFCAPHHEGTALHPVITHIAARTDGVPLFVEELTRALLESGLLREERDRYALDRPIRPFAIPPSLHASLLARLDRLGPAAKEMAQIGAAIGRDFSYELLAAVAQRSEAELKDPLSRIVNAGLVFQRGSPPDATFLFKHALVQDAAYGTLLRGRRQSLHARIARVLEERFPSIAEIQPQTLAQHYAEAGMVEKSVAWWGKAGYRSAARSGMAEAVAQFQKALDQLVLLPGTPELQLQELQLLSGLGAALMVVKGFAALETGRAYARARELWEQLGFPSEFLHIPRGQSIYYAVRGELDLALRLDEDLLRVSRQRNDAAGLVLGHVSAGRTLMFTGRLSSSQSHLEEALAFYDTVSRSALVDQAGVDPYVNSQALLGSVHFCRGFPDRALARSNAAIAEAQRLGHQPSLAVTLALGARVTLLLGDNAALDQRAGQLIAMSTEQSFAY